MAKQITLQQLERAVAKAPAEIRRAGGVFLVRGLAEYKRIARSAPWRVGQSGGGIPRDSGNLREQHRTKITGLRGTYGVSENQVPYAKYVHGHRNRPVKVHGRNIETRPWLAYAMDKGDRNVRKHYKEFMDTVLKTIAV